VAAVIRAIDPEQPVAAIRTMMELRDGQLASQRFTALLLGFFAGAFNPYIALSSDRSGRREASSRPVRNR